jgi:hypothetical protein
MQMGLIRQEAVMSTTCGVMIDWPTWKESFSSNGAKGHDLGYKALQNKPIIELRPEFKEPEFPGFLNFMEPLPNDQGTLCGRSLWNRRILRTRRLSSIDS